MGRLTMRPNICQMASTEYCLEHKDCYECEHGRNVFRKLCEYEDLEEQGRLVILPCKVGDVLWTYANYPCEYIYPFEVRGIRLMEKEISTDRVGAVKWDNIGKTVFLTRAEAEAALTPTPASDVPEGE